jgi:HK97 family phage major capsid protein/ATP-dependent Clp endopeptidase proteolytic subunit ClpP
MKQQDEDEAEIVIYGDIGEGFFSEGIGADQFQKELKALGAKKRITVCINSPGGSVFEGLAIYNQLEMHKAEIVVRIDGLAGSIASVIAMAGDTVLMPENAMMFIHDPWSMVAGDAEDMRKAADALDKIKLSILSAYRKKTGLSDDELARMMTEETWMLAEEALDKGFCDELIGAVQMAAAIKGMDLTGFKHVPQALLTQAEEPKKPKEVHHMKCKKHPGTDMVLDECPDCQNEAKQQNALQQTRQNELNRVRALRAIGKEFTQTELAESAIEMEWSEDDLRKEILARALKARKGNEPLNISVTPRHEGKPFRAFGEQLMAVANAARGKMDHRLLEVYNAPTGASESATSDGGFLIQSDFTTELLDLMHETEILAPRCRIIPISGNRIDAPIVDETSRATGSRFGGVQVYRVAEGGAGTPKKPKISMWSMSLQKLMGVFYSTDELMADTTALENLASRAFAEEMGFKKDDEILNGSGTGEMLGIIPSGAMVSVAKETGQLAKTIVPENIINMYSRMPARSKPNSVWVINSECMPQIMMLNLVMGTAAVPLYFPPGGLSAAPYGTIFGRPVIEVEQAAALGTVGDILYVDLSKYGIIEKGGLNAAQSIHVNFLTDETVFRWTMRNNGMPIAKAPITPYKSDASFKASPFVGLATR